MAIQKIEQNSDCELELWLQAPKEVPRNYKTLDILANHSLWIKTSRLEKWIFATKKPEIVDIECRNRETIRLAIKKSGIISFYENCKLRNKDIIIYNAKLHTNKS